MGVCSRFNKLFRVRPRERFSPGKAKRGGGNGFSRFNKFYFSRKREHQEKKSYQMPAPAPGSVNTLENGVYSHASEPRGRLVSG